MTSGRSLVLRLAAVPLVGAVVGALVGGVVGRLAMLVLARLSPEATGRLSDDGFVMGRFTVSGSLNLLAFGAVLGVVGGVVYVAVRGLLLGPEWFRTVCVGLGSGVPVGNQLVHVDGLDFTLLQPLWLTVGFFVVIPALYGVVLTLVVEHRLLARWPVGGAARRRRVDSLLWGGRAVAFAVGAASLLQLLGKVRDLA
ncbi:hypothetical protein [Nocardioides sp.]|uniref:hypothetical protein n=1 Tax=Nocardioides sp. TaxID=35761 RepID=UPI00286C4421|nr:hypothetical protein [Nocardioides sp.]